MDERMGKIRNVKIRNLQRMHNSDKTDSE